MNISLEDGHNIKIDKGNSCFIIAEVGQNHNGDIGLAKELIKIAKECGADCVKFQKTSLEDRFTSSALEYEYNSENSFGRTYGEHRKALEFDEEQFQQLKNYAKDIGILFSSSGMDIPSMEFLGKRLKVPFIKIGSGDANNFELIEFCASMMIPIILSTGMQDFSSVKHSVNIIRKYHNNFAILHCVSAYPTNPSDTNIRVIETYQEEFSPNPIGYSGHEKGYYIAIAAVTLGAKIIEKHLTKDKRMKGTDHKCSLDPYEFKTMVQGIRQVELSLGDRTKRFLKCEEACQNKLGKSLVSKRTLVKGSKIRIEDLSVKVSKPKGINPFLVNTVIGKYVKNEIKKDLPLLESDLISKD